jgi:hypothetical protein
MSKLKIWYDSHTAIGEAKTILYRFCTRYLLLTLLTTSVTF